MQTRDHTLLKTVASNHNLMPTMKSLNTLRIAKLCSLAGACVLLGGASLLAQPAITNQPVSQTNIAGATVTFSVGATGTPPLSYQWRSHANANTFTNIPWGTEATLVLTNVQPTPRRFAVVVTDVGGLSATSSPLVTLTVVTPPSIRLDEALLSTTVS